MATREYYLPISWNACLGPLNLYATKRRWNNKDYDKILLGSEVKKKKNTKERHTLWLTEDTSETKAKITIRRLLEKDNNNIYIGISLIFSPAHSLSVHNFVTPQRCPPWAASQQLIKFPVPPAPETLLLKLLKFCGLVEIPNAIMRNIEREFHCHPNSLTRHEVFVVVFSLTPRQLNLSSSPRPVSSRLVSSRSVSWSVREISQRVSWWTRLQIQVLPATSPLSPTKFTFHHNVTLPHDLKSIMGMDQVGRPGDNSGTNGNMNKSWRRWNFDENSFPPVLWSIYSHSWRASSHVPIN